MSAPECPGERARTDRHRQGVFEGSNMISDFYDMMQALKDAETTSPSHDGGGIGSENSMRGRKVAVVGAGISGLSAALLLKLNGAEVTLYERESSCGGHALTVDVDVPRSSTSTRRRSDDDLAPTRIPVDVGFQVFNYSTYPNFVAMLESLGVESDPSDMSFSFSTELLHGDGHETRVNEWGSRNINALMASSINLSRPGFWRLMYDVSRFSDDVDAVLDAPSTRDRLTVGEFLRRKRYSTEFAEEYFFPMCASIWSAPCADIQKYPARWLFSFWRNHHLLNILKPRPIWRVVRGSSRSYVNAVLDVLTGARERQDDGVAVLGASRVMTSTEVVAIRSLPGGVDIATKSAIGDSRYSEVINEAFDDVILATHSDVSSRLLSGDNRFQDFTHYLGQLEYAGNTLVLHTDASFMPSDRRCWAAWNYTRVVDPASSDREDRAVCVTYWINVLQNLPAGCGDVFATLNPRREIDPECILQTFEMAHPSFGVRTEQLVASLQSIQGFNHVCLAGAWMGYGFHEDGVTSAMVAVKRMGATVPWEDGVVGDRIGRAKLRTSPEMSALQWASFYVFDALCARSIRVGSSIGLRLIMPSGYEYHYGCTGHEVGGGRDLCTVRVLDASFFVQVLTRQDIGLGEAFMSGAIDVSDIGMLMDCLVLNIDTLSRNLASPVFSALSIVSMTSLAWIHSRRDNSKSGSRQNIRAHYDLGGNCDGNDLYRTFLDYTMTYSSGYHERGHDTPLEEAQITKLSMILDRAGAPKDAKVHPHPPDAPTRAGAADKTPAPEPFHILEIGCGWGSCAIEACMRSASVRVTGITLSENQLSEARERVRAAGFEDRVDLLLLDYRDVAKQFSGVLFDACVSIEMIEAVGAKHFDDYFGSLSRAVKPGGKVAIQAICIPDERYAQYSGSSDFIREYIFPGGHMPCRRVITYCARAHRLGNLEFFDIGEHYAETLRQWRNRFTRSHWKIVHELGYTETFYRMWIFYFAYCEAAFRHGHLHDFMVSCVRESD